jgi:excisionase family DNA binding protein
MTGNSMREKSPSRLLKAREVARRLNVSKAMAYRLMQRGEIRCVRIGTAVRVRPTDLTAYIQANLTNQPTL